MSPLKDAIASSVIKFDDLVTIFDDTVITSDDNEFIDSFPKFNIL